MGILKIISKKKEQKKARTIPYSREKVKRITSYLIFSLIIISIFFNIAFFNKYQYIRSVAAKSEKNVNDSLQEKKKSTLLTENAAITFAKNFLNNYINIPRDLQQREKRTQDIKNLLIKDLAKEIDNTKEFKGERKIKNATLIEKRDINSKLADFHFLVNYDVDVVNIEKQKVKEGEVEVEKDVEVPKKLQRTNEIVIRLTTDGKGFAVANLPQFSTKRDLNSQIENKEKKPYNAENLSIGESRKLEKFLKDYFEAFAGNNTKQLSYMTFNPRGLENYKFISLNRGDYYKIDKTYYTDVSVTMEDKDSKLQVIQNYKFALIKKSGEFYIENEK
ncbi:conjugal transfer protein [Bacillus pseudomycoides]|uniref:conjugal transfer protein n=1 Tax=Bacillus pseudomycoides TaxID=64104 RepID=UPI003CF7B71D